MVVSKFSEKINQFREGKPLVTPKMHCQEDVESNCLMSAQSGISHGISPGLFLLAIFNLAINC